MTEPRRLSRGSAAALLFGLVWWSAGCRSFPEELDTSAGPRPQDGMVVSEHPVASSVGADILGAGGNAVDAAVATALALAVVYPQAGNLGGGGFALWVPHAGEARALDFREAAPAAVEDDTYYVDGEPNSELSLWTHLAAGVPGSPAGLFELHRELGRLSFGRVAAPAIELASRGVRVDVWLARDLESPTMQVRLSRDSDTLAVFTRPDGGWLEEGDLWVQPELAETLRRLVERGPAGFYSGPTAERIVAEMASGNGLIDAADLDDYRPVWRAPLRGWFRGREVITMPPPSSGGIVVLQVLAVLDGFPLDSERERAMQRATTAGREPGAGVSERALHWWIEALRLAFADRAVHMGDPDHWDVPTAELLSPALVAERRTLGIGELANPDVMAWAPAPSNGGGETTHLSVLDSDGNAVSLTTTLNTSFGSGLVVGGAGFLLNNEMDDFAVHPGVPNTYGLVGSEANAVVPRKRPLSSMTPTVLRDNQGTVVMVVGSPGGPRIITSVLEVILRVLVYGQDLETAIEAPRLHQQWKPVKTYFEPGWDAGVLAGLRARGHEIDSAESRWSSVQGITVEPGGNPVGYSDSRRGGLAVSPERGPVHAPSKP